jgi:adenylate cyclase
MPLGRGAIIACVEPRETATVLFAEMIGSLALYDAADDSAASSAIDDCMKSLRELTRSAGGEVVKTIGDEVMASFPTPDAAATAASRMHAAVESLAPVADKRLALRVGFHAGPVLRRDGDLFGDTVNLAARLAGQATPGQILTSRETADRLSPAVRNCTRVLYSVEVKGKSASVELCELLWQQSADVTDVASHDSAPLASLRVRHHGHEVEAPEGGLAIGRDRDCDIVVEDEHVSRRHCTIQRRHGKFIVQDHSANGTYVSVDGEREVVLHREEYVLRGSGWIALGQPRGKSMSVLEYVCE